MNEEFEKWFRAEVIAGRLYSADEDAAHHAWQASRKHTIEEAAKACELSGSEFSRSDVNGRCGEHVYEDVAKDCAAAHGISRSLVYGIKRGTHWPHL